MCVHDGLQIFFLPVAGQHERPVFAVSDRAAERALENPPLLGRAHQRKCVARIQYRIAENEIERSVVVRARFFGDNFEASPARTPVLRGIRILVDADFLHGRGGYCHAGDFHAVHDRLHAARPDGPGIEKDRHRRDVVLVEDRHLLQKVLVPAGGVQVIGDLGRNLRRLFADDCQFRHYGGQRQFDRQRRRRPAANLQRRDRPRKTLVLDFNRVAAVADAFEAKSASGVRLHRFLRRVGILVEGHRRVRHRGAPLVEHRPSDSHAAGAILRRGAG